MAHGQMPVFLKYISKNLEEVQRLHLGLGHKTMPYFRQLMASGAWPVQDQLNCSKCGS